MAAGDDAILAFRPPSLGRMRLWLTLARVWHRPSFTGLEHVDPSRPMMFVGNHTLYGVQDVPHILYELARVRGVFPRTLADRPLRASGVARSFDGGRLREGDARELRGAHA